MTEEQMAKLPPYKKILKISRDNGACSGFLRRAARCNSYQEAITKEKIDLISWFRWLACFFTGAAWAECEKVTDAARAECVKVTDAARAEYVKVRDAALIQGVINSFG